VYTPGTRYRRCRPTLTLAQWCLIEALAQAACEGRWWPAASIPLREIVNAMLYVLRGGIAWRMMPSDLPPWRTVYGQFRR
jgi:transposase